MTDSITENVDASETTPTTRIHDVRIIDRKISCPRNDRWVQSCIKGDSMKITWDAEWDELNDVYAVFVNAADGVRSNAIQIVDGACPVPSSVLQTNGRLFMTVIGYTSEGKRIVTQKMERPFLVNESGDVYDTLLPEVTADILATVINCDQIVHEAVARADAAVALVLTMETVDEEVALRAIGDIFAEPEEGAE